MRWSTFGGGRAHLGEHSALRGRDDAEADEHQGRLGGGFVDGDGIVKIQTSANFPEIPC